MAFGQTGINTGSGAEVTTDQVGTAVTQVIKLDGGVSGSSAPILGSTANGLDVDVTRIVDGADATQGTTTDAAVTTDANGTLSGKLRGLVKIFADVWDSTNHWLKVDVATAIAAGSNKIGGVTIADGDAATIGAKADAAVVTDASGSVTGFLRGLVKLFVGWFPAAAALADGTANPTVTQIEVFPMIWNGTTWDQQRDSVKATNSLAGSQAVGLMIYDTVANQNKRANSILSAVAGGLTGSNVPAMGTMVYNGSGFYALKGNGDGSLPVGGFTARLTSSPTIKTTAFSAGQDMGGLITLTSAVRNSGSSGAIVTVIITDKSNQKSAIDVVFFTVTPGSTTLTDGTALAVNAADLINICGTVSVLATDYISFSANAVAVKGNLGIGMVLSGTSLFAALVCRGTPTYTGSTDIELSVIVAQD